MPNATWPASLPQAFLASAYSEQRGVATLRSKMGTGPDKVRRRFTAVPTAIAASMKMTTAQTVTLDVFFQQTLSEGALICDWVHPRTGAQISLRITEPPTFNPVGPDRWLVALKIEVLP